MAMENNDLEDKIRKMVKEKIAVSNIKEEFKMKFRDFSLCSICIRNRNFRWNG